jgi:3-oxoacid CoA-transferase subunit A
LIDKVVGSAAQAVADIGDGSSIAVGGFGICGVPLDLIDAIYELGSSNLAVVSNNCGIDGYALGVLLGAARISRATCSYVGENKEFARQYLSGELELELTPQGSLAERMRAGGAGIPAFFTLAGVGTQISDGGLPLKYGSDGSVVKASEPKEVRTFNGREYVLEQSITTDFAFVRAAVGDRHGNLVYDATAQNFNPACATAGRITIAEVERLVEPGEIPAGQVHTPGIFVQRVVVAQPREKRIEKLTLQPAYRDMTGA